MDEARAQAELARQLDPTSTSINVWMALTFYNSRDDERAIEQARRTIELDASSFNAHRVLAFTYLQQGRYAESLAELDRAEQLGGEPDPGPRGMIYALQGRRADALRARAQLDDPSKRGPYPRLSRALVDAALGDLDSAFADLDEAYLDRESRMRVLKVDPRFDNLRSDPRFATLLKKMNLQ